MEKRGGGPAARSTLVALAWGLVVLLAGAALAIPFVYESQTLWYKVGHDKTLLRTGQMVGLLAAVLIFVQMLLGVRGRLLEEIFGVAQLTRRHRQNGLILAVLVVLHVTLVLLTEGLSGLLALKAWPELVGAVLLVVILIQAVSSLFRRHFGLAFATWRRMHRSLAYLAPILLAIHILFVSDSFAHGLPRVGLLTILAVVAVTILAIKWPARRQGKVEG